MYPFSIQTWQFSGFLNLIRLKELCMSKNKHLTLENRITIQTELNKGTSFKGIASLLDKECTTISKEIRNHIHYEKSSAAEPAVSVLITAPPILNTPVQNLTPPYVCNPCKDRARCSLEKGRVKKRKVFHASLSLQSGGYFCN